MKIAIWIVQGLLSLMFLMAGVMKLMTPAEELAAMEGMGWANDFSANTIMMIGALEVLAVIGMTAPLLLKKYEFFSPLSALGLAGIMIGAIMTHMGRGEDVMMPIMLLVGLLFVAYGRKDHLMGK